MFVPRLFACLVVFSLSASAGAQTPPSAPPAQQLAVEPLTAVGQKKPGPRPVRVARTAAKTDTQLQDVPAAVVIVPEQVLHQQDAQTLDQAARNASGVTPVMGGSYGFADRYLAARSPGRASILSEKPLTFEEIGPDFWPRVDESSLDEFTI